MKEFLRTLNALYDEEFQLYNLFVKFTPEEDLEIRRYCSYTSLLGHSTRVVDRFFTMTPPENSEERYLVVWGVLQAFIIQQDAIRKLHRMFVESKGTDDFNSKFTAWRELRKLRDATAGHPTGDNFVNSIMIVARDSKDWGVLGAFPVGATPIHSYIRERLPQYETELLEAFKPIADALQRRVEENATDL